MRRTHPLAWPTGLPPGIDLHQIHHDVALGVRLVPTPGHTPGHQSVFVDHGRDRVTVICAQASWDTDTFAVGSIGDEHAWDVTVGDASVAALRALRPARVLLSHDPRAWRPGA
ncbi:hypothetical protein BH23ACT2_BH23ACT2_14440 [soil metagenome]